METQTLNPACNAFVFIFFKRKIPDFLRKNYRLAFASLSILLAFFLPLNAQSQSQPRYNVLFIAIDDMTQRTDFFGYPEMATPNVQRIINRGVLFNKCYVQYALCSPSRTSFLSGWRPDRTRIFDDNIEPRSIIDSTVTFLPEYFKKSGYRTERYGKIMHVTFENDVTWDYADPAETGGVGLNLLKKDVDGEQIMSGLKAPLPLGAWWVNQSPDSATYDGMFSRDLASRLQQPPSQPFFYGLGLVSPHYDFSPNLKSWNLSGDPSVQESLPININGDTLPGFVGNGSGNLVIPNEPANDRGDIPRAALPYQLIKSPYDLKRTIHAYEGEVSQMDTQLGLVLDKMDSLNLWSNTIVIFFSDHGQHLGEHEGLWRKQTLFEEALHIPLIVCVPGKPAGVCNKFVELIDIYPTLLELCKLPPVPGTEGSSFAPLLDDPGQQWKDAVFAQVKRNTIMGRSVTTDAYRYNSWEGGNGEELYDRVNDPKEYTNLASNPSYAAALADMRNKLAEGWQKHQPPARDTIAYYKDADGDGYGSAADSIRSTYLPIGFSQSSNDCDDNNNLINPGAAELCDGIDNNCDGLIDNIAGSYYYRDADNDGFGSQADSLFLNTCLPPEGYVSNNTDCDDNNNTVYPGATEIIDSLDNNCDGRIDEAATATVFYRDLDGDGYGDAMNVVQSTSKIAGYVSDNTDCDDNNSTVHPNAVELCNGIDDDCDGLIDETTLQTSSTAGTILCKSGTTTVNVTATGGSGSYNGSGLFTVASGPYQFTVTDSYGCAASTSGTIADGISLPPAAPPYIKGTTYNLCGGGNYTYTTANITGATSYTWTTPASFALVQNNGKSALIKVPSTFTSGSISVKANNDCGSSITKALVVYAIAPNPSAGITGPATVSSGQTNVTYQITSLSGISYNWTVPSGSVITSGQGTNKITVNFGSTGGSITVILSNNCGSSPMGKKTVTVSPTFAMAKNQDKDVSPVLHGIEVYPNPAQSLMNVLFNANKEGDQYKLLITDLNGKEIYTKQGVATKGSNNLQLDVSKFSAAVYVLKIVINDHVEVAKIIKEK